MKIIFLNIWHAHVWDKLQEYILSEAKIADILCFTEVGPELQTKLVRLLPDFQPFYDELIKTDYLDEGIDGQTIFIKRGVRVINHTNMLAYKITRKDAGGFQVAEVGSNGGSFFIGSVHGKAKPGHKLDTPARIKQSKIIIDYFKHKNGPKIIGGDFNLMPNTKSVKMFEMAGYRNLIEEYKIGSTRNHFSWEQAERQFKERGEQFFERQYFADYLFISPDIKVKNFEVPNIEISDHLPLVLEFDIKS
ncbi:MAG: hypothetical protein HYV90_00940 [Candidatus Woesebacteria bacterium]|nr:MAG: hypothetical protein HYV90_00940 [Candidatus Woesebacteria bacterium]